MMEKMKESLERIPMKLGKILLLAALGLHFAFCASSQSKIARENENSPQYQYEKAVLAMKYDLIDEAIKYLNQALTLDPNHYQSYCSPILQKSITNSDLSIRK